MKAFAIGSVLALTVFAACSQPVNHIPEGAEKVFDLRTGNELTVKKAAKADGIKNWKINTAYRSFQEQKKILDYPDLSGKGKQ